MRTGTHAGTTGAGPDAVDEASTAAPHEGGGRLGHPAPLPFETARKDW